MTNLDKVWTSSKINSPCQKHVRLRCCTVIEEGPNASFELRGSQIFVVCIEFEFAIEQVHLKFFIPFFRTGNSCLRHQILEAKDMILISESFAGLLCQRVAPKPTGLSSTARGVVQIVSKWPIAE